MRYILAAVKYIKCIGTKMLVNASNKKLFLDKNTKAQKCMFLYLILEKSVLWSKTQKIILDTDLWKVPDMIGSS